MQELSLREIDQVNGAILANAAGAVCGAVGAIFGTIIGGNQETDAVDILTAGLAGGVAGAVNPVRSIAGVVKVIGGSVAGGGSVNIARDLIGITVSRSQTRYGY